MIKFSKIIKTAVLIIFLLMIIVLLRYYYGTQYYYPHNAILNSNNEYIEDELNSDDNLYTLKTKEINISNVSYVSFFVEDKNHNIVYNCQDKYRYYDLKDIKWNHHDIIVESSDVGSIVYSFTNGTWLKLF